MPWNGSGTYTRGYPSWSSDASAGLPISATKFDTEDNDFAAGIQNCLTIDSQNKPNATLTWAQAIALSKTTDATLFSVARSNGTNNPVFQIQTADATGVTLNLTTAQQLALATNGANRLTLSGTGAGVINAPSSGVAFTINGTAANVHALQIISGQTPSQNASDLEIDRSGSTGNTIAGGPNLQLFDTTNTTATAVQHSAGQTEIWQYNGAWVQSLKILANKQVQVLDDGGTMQTIGWRGTPYNSQGSNYTLQLSDRGKAVKATASITVTVPQNIFSAGDVVTIVVTSGATVTIAQGTGVTLQWAGNGSTTGNRTLTGAGMASILFDSGGVGVISGPGLT